ncbi:hypothetical protein L210DRAFT_3649995 [Boletus edulis BED1]|uniref:Uncharacterized protein n=1 Tax=Boletus edulis BED1 TaxID=1328754 RepID=A0AAD4GAL3_BOLED|nr:hypothetical protein L210DRAFT_3649995 [Boletus edulis BED1]
MSNDPQYPYGVSTMACLSSSSPRLDFNTLNLTNTISEHSYTPSANYYIPPPPSQSSLYPSR